MLRAIPWTVLALAPVAHARFGRLSPDEKLNECCPCPSPGQSSSGGTIITITQPAQTVYVSLAQEPSIHTVTVERTVTIDAHTVYVTQSDDSQYVSPRPWSEFTQRSGPQTVTSIQVDGQGGAQKQYQPLPVTTTIQPESRKRLSYLSPMTVTAKTDPPVEPVSSVSVAQYQPSLEAPWSPSSVAVTQQQQPTPSAVTVTASLESPASTAMAIQPQGPQTVTVTIQPSFSSAQPAAVTASAQVQTIFQTIDHYTTLTKTVGGGGGDNIEIIIINIFTGESFCKKKHSGKSCHTRGHTRSHRYLSSAAAGTAAVTATGPSQMPRPSVNVTTGVGSTYNTGIVKLPSGNFTGAAQPTGSGRPVPIMGRKPRSPFSPRKW
ncbi:hypothetical protein E4U21_007695 [Claviceps maximensis]|nr:hypothetical protein E4U21_007695 [Claviceps maximensis]